MSKQIREEIEAEIGVLLLHYDDARGQKEIDKAIDSGIDAICHLLERQDRESRIDELEQFDVWLAERSHLDLRKVAAKRVRDHIWLRLESPALKSAQEKKDDE